MSGGGAGRWLSGVAIDAAASTVRVRLSDVRLETAGATGRVAATVALALKNVPGTGVSFAKGGRVEGLVVTEGTLDGGPLRRTETVRLSLEGAIMRAAGSGQEELTVTGTTTSHTVLEEVTAGGRPSPDKASPDKKD